MLINKGMTSSVQNTDLLQHVVFRKKYAVWLFMAQERLAVNGMLIFLIGRDHVVPGFYPFLCVYFCFLHKKDIAVWSLRSNT